MLWNSLLFLFGVFLLLISTNVLIATAERVALVLKLSPLIIGITIVAIGTSLPELTISLISALQDDTGLAIGNIIGSNIVNIVLVLPIGILTGKIKIGTTKTQKNITILGGATLLFVLLNQLNIQPIVSGLLLLSSAVFITVYEYLSGIFGRTHEDKHDISTKNQQFNSKELFIGIVSIIGIAISGIIIVSSVEEIAHMTGLSTSLLGLSLVAVATSLPELMATIFSQKNNNGKMTIGNIIGSNVYNLTLVGGIVIISSSSWSSIRNMEYWLLLGTTLLFIFIIKKYKGKIIHKTIGWYMLILFLFYLITLQYA